MCIKVRFKSADEVFDHYIPGLYVQAQSNFFHAAEIEKSNGETNTVAFDGLACVMNDNGSRLRILVP